MHDLPRTPDTRPVLELRQYTLHPGQREPLIDLFERHFLDGQEACGIRVLGQFRDAGDPDRFVWVRAFRDMPARAEALRCFYGGPLWKEHREAANATMVDSDNVLLLRPVGASDALTPGRAALYVATIYLLARPADEDFLRFFETQVRPVLQETGAPPIARFVTESAANNFPALPVRTGEHAFVWFASFASAADHEQHLARRKVFRSWNELVQPALQELRLEPTTHSRLGRGRWRGALHDFDFLAGRWSIVNRRLLSRGVCRDAWEEFPATSEVTLHLGGVANVDEIHFTTKGWSGMTIRTFDRRERQWSIHWVNSTQGRLFPPVVGGFDGDRGEFRGEDDDDGRPVKVLFVWTRKGPGAARWEQSFSYDGGRTWETNWVMEMTHAQDQPGARTPGRQ
jgi:quinol monooxygenase YgiN